MILTIAAIAFFILAKIASHYTEKYSGCDDCSWLAWFIGEYWRTSRAIPTTLLYAGLMCVWFETRHLEIVQGLAVLLLFFSAFALMLGLALLIGKTVEAIFGHWDLSEIGYNFGQIRENWAAWLKEFNFVDRVGSLAFNSVTLLTCGITIWSMVITVAPLLAD